MNITILSLLLVYVVIVCLQYLYTRYKDKLFPSNSKLDAKIKFNNDHYAELKEFLATELQNRVDLLTEGKMSYREWIKYNKENMLVKFNDKEYYFFIFERGENSEGTEQSAIETVVHANKNYVGLSWVDVMKDVGEKFVFLKQTTDPNLIRNMFEIGRHGITALRYFWPDPLELKPVSKESQVLTVPSGEDHNEFLIGIGIDLDNLDTTNKFYYVNNIHYGYIALISILTVTISILTILFSKPNHHAPWKPFAFLILTNLYLTHFLNNSEYYGNASTEIKKVDQINSGINSVSFLVGVNTFIITSLTRSSDVELFTQSAVVFAISIILLLFSAFKITDAITIHDLIEDRLGNQLIFNFSILLNVFVVLNYVVSILRTDPRIIKKLASSKPLLSR